MSGPRYGKNVRMGNWSEDEARFDLAAKDYEARRSKGELLHLRKARETAFLSQAAPLSFSPDGLVRFGDSVQLATGGGGGAAPALLSNHVFSFLAPGHARVTAGPAARAQARNVWVLRAGGGGFAPAPDGVLRFGDRVRLECDAALVADTDTGVCGLPLALRSARGNNLLGTARNGKQEVSMTAAPAGDADAEWRVACASGDRLATDGARVRAGAPLALVHVMSNVALATRAGDVYPSDFGAELDVFAATARATGQASASLAGALAPAPFLPANVWRFVGAASAAEGADARGLTPLSPAALLARVRAAVAAAAGLHGFRSLFLSFANLDPRGAGALPAGGLRAALAAHGARLADAEFALLVAPFAAPAAGAARAAPGAGGGAPAAVARAPFAAALRGPPLGPAAAASVAEAYALLDAAPGGATAGALKARYDGKADPRARAGALSRVEAKAEFARQWPALGARADAPVSAADFADYYADVGAALPDAAALAAVVANAWHVPGRGDWLVKKDKRVLVTFHKGSSTEALIKGGEAIADDDQEALAAALAKMKIGGVARVKVLGLVEAAEE